MNGLVLGRVRDAEIVEVVENDFVMDVVPEIVNDIEDVDVAVCVWEILTEMLEEWVSDLLKDFVIVQEAEHEAVCDGEKELEDLKLVEVVRD